MHVYLTGEGFIGSKLKGKLMSSLPLDYTHIPHNKISETKLERFDYFYFFSTYGNMYDHTDEDRMFQANINDLLHILIEAKQYPFKSFVFLSSSSVKLKPTTYSRLKKAGEEILLSQMDKHQLPILIIRPFSVTGVGEQKEHLIPTLIDSCFTGKLVNFVPEPRHDFIDVDDLVDGILNLSQLGIKGIYELGSGKSYSNQEVLDLVEKVTGKKANINKVDSMRSYDTQDWKSTNLKARGYGWLPRKSLEQSITEMVKAYEN
jgi:nucleoside-diphosphate-sugar epimerase